MCGEHAPVEAIRRHCVSSPDLVAVTFLLHPGRQRRTFCFPSEETNGSVVLNRFRTLLTIAPAAVGRRSFANTLSHGSNSDCPEGAGFTQPRAPPWENWPNRTDIVGPTGQSFKEPLARWADGLARSAPFPRAVPWAGRTAGPSAHVTLAKKWGLLAGNPPSPPAPLPLAGEGSAETSPPAPLPLAGEGSLATVRVSPSWPLILSPPRRSFGTRPARRR